ncbi:glutamyl-tRNA synthetase [Ruminococcus sp. YE71]|uniref:glutamate--tRNA ligase n=1 Tax=unclassified Ruminococcus TaxID=2608920 RepID=UPI0008804FAA|nr:MULTISPECIES: glutamate--tRNA ligase [unclassified Ruminococcus]SDA19761.1 glutamyl-tRNA synthetase [Ruminococcus sp. YE78]SFW31292.1 glutamyl-tRNA synthetase [Ruminococcus sp. YE71]
MITTRFAPSPTGFMHIGNLRTALYSYLLSKSQGGKFILRIEDTDQVRLVEGATDVILKTLEMTGIDYDEGPVVGGEHGPYIQSERLPIYKEYAEKLIASGHAYYCFCTPERLESLKDDKGIGGYDGHCRSLSKEEVEKNLAEGKPYVIRQKMPSEGTTSYVDEVYGEVTMDNSELRDQILIKADGYPTYNFCHVIDDYLMGVTHVVRGNEYLTSTPKYCLLYDAFGWERPHYVHLPLLMGKDAEGNVSKLSKRHGAVSFQDLVDNGYLPEAIVNYIALLGWCPKDSNEEFFTMDELKKSFSMEGLSKSPAVFDYEKLKWFNSEYIKKLPDEEYEKKALPILDEICAESVDKKKLAELLHSRIATFAEIREMSDFVVSRLPMEGDLYTNKKNKTTPEICKEVLVDALPVLEGIGQWDNDTLFAELKEFAASKEKKVGAVMWAVRVAVGRKAVTPGGATELMTVLGKTESIERIKQAISEL